MAQVKGSAQRKIRTPGYHIQPKYDLPGLRQRKQDGAKRSFDSVLPLTSMVDMFSMLVIFLILNYSTTGEAFFISHDMKLPKAINGRPLESLPLISITDQEVIFESEKVGKNPLHLERKDNNLPLLRKMLRKARALEESIHPGERFKGAVNIQADQGLAIVYVKRVMNTLISEGWTEIHFAVREDD